MNLSFHENQYKDGKHRDDLDALWEDGLQAQKDDPLQQKAVERSRPDAVSDLVGWKLCELTRARIRKHGGISREYFNMLLYLRRVGCVEWLETFAELDEWLQQSQRTFESLPVYPKKRSKVPKERKLAEWVARNRRYWVDNKNVIWQAQNYLLHTLDGWGAWIHDAGERNVAADMRGTGRSSSVWAVKFEEVEAWLLNNGVLPRQHSQDAKEKKLGSWLKRNRALRTKTLLDGSRQHMLGMVDPERSPHMVWNASFDQADRWFQSHTEPPKRNASDDGERQIAVWLMHTKDRMRSKSLSEDQKEKLASASWWQPEGAWMSGFSAADAWFTQHPDKKPSRTSSEACERRVAVWIMHNKAALKEGKLTSKQKRVLRCKSWWQARAVPKKREGGPSSRY